MEESDFVHERLKIIDQTVRDTVNGFIKHCQDLLPETNTYYTIPIGVYCICLIYYSPSLKHGTYEIEGDDKSESDRIFKAKYELEFCKDGTIFGNRGSQLICGGWSGEQNNEINFMLTWRGSCYQYNGYFDTISNEMNGKWYIKNDKKRKNTGQYGTFKYKYKYKSELSAVKQDPNNINNIKLHQEYQILLEKYETMKRNTTQIINTQDAEIFALKLLLIRQKNEIDEYKSQLISDEKENDNNDDIIDYKQWNWQDILKWIINKNIKYIKYQSILKQKLCEEDVKGTHLCYIDKNDLHRFGIVHFEHKVEIYQYIQQLINHSNHKE